MKLSDKIKTKLSPLAFSLGGAGVLELLPTDTIIAATAHPDEVIGIHDYGYKFELRNITGDYEVFNSQLESKYTNTPPVDSLWGESEIDLVYMTQLRFGEYFYVAYTDDQDDRFIMVVRA